MRLTDFLIICFVLSIFGLVNFSEVLLTFIGLLFGLGLPLLIIGACWIGLQKILKISENKAAVIIMVLSLAGTVSVCAACALNA